MSIVKAEDIAFVRFRAPDLAKMRAFLEDFGLSCLEQGPRLYGRGTDGAPYLHITEEGQAGFAGLGFRLTSTDDLARLAEGEGAHVHAIDEPGGGLRLHLRDPDGNLVEVVAGQAWTDQPAAAPDTPINTPQVRRRIRAAVRFAPGPSSVFRLGHVVLNVADFERSQAWYKAKLGLITSDQIDIEPGKTLGAFLRCDRGAVPTDHHTLFLLQAPEAPGFNHAAFEVAGLDDLMKGHTFLKSRGRDHAWGIGRHVLGSQIFDYWRDPWGHELEHWTDGDLFTAADPPGVAGLTELLGALWGPPHPAAARGQ